MSHRSKFFGKLDSAQALCNFLRLERHAFYKATRGLHSVMSIPEPEYAARSQLQFHHASFQDFLLDPNRSGKLVIGEQKVLVDILSLYLYWYEVDLTLFHTHDVWNFDTNHEHDSLSGLIWASEDNRLQLSQSITSFLAWGLFKDIHEIRLDGVSQDILFQLSNNDFKYWYPWNIFYLVHICRVDPSTSVVRVEPSNPMDDLLFKHINLMIGNRIAKPAVFPLTISLPGNKWIREYLFIGHGVKSVIVWRTSSPTSNNIRNSSLRCDEEPSEAQISEYNRYLELIGWDEAKAKS